MAKRGLGWKPSLPDHRNLVLHFPKIDVPEEVDLRETGHLPSAVWDQGDLGSCVAHGVGAAYIFALKAGGGREIDPARLFLYYNGRVLEGTVDQDSGLTCADGIKALVKQGVPPEDEWPYVIERFTERPTEDAFRDALERQALKYAAVRQDEGQMKACLAAGTPIVIGFTVYESLFSDAVERTGIVPLPSRRERVEGGHCVLVVGYKKINGKLYWICRNSWGKDWADKGHFYLPAEYLTNRSLATDFWTVYTVEAGPPTPEPPTPDPAPVPDVDKTLFDTTSAWMIDRHTREAKVTANALVAWAKAKGYMK